ncbi:MAG TPA: polar amino acid ABC transporter ATP-binding protein [Tistrella mobilis]|uniref:Polar amino acid ABC transporter ATP-binding protein n=1 Tax=Tistrella mobilis TaxID=171437 RepID=A0A3B9ING2_9PROT|nr:polar amino acid ABC transporter ATP-binding protein [Tistrella mobilis]
MTTTSSSAPRPMVEVRNAHKRYGALEVLKGIDLTVDRGRIIAIIGPSGSGKSTLLRSINHLETLNEGEIFLDGVQVNAPLAGAAFERHINAVRQQMGMVFQHFNLFPHLTVGRNVTLALTLLKGMSEAEAREVARDQLAKVGLADRMDTHPARLSGGQKQRVAIARALAMGPKVMLFDEATSALDTETEAEIQTALKRAGEGRTVITIAHRLSTVADADRIVVLEKGEVVEEGTHEGLLARGGRYAQLWARQQADRDAA